MGNLCVEGILGEENFNIIAVLCKYNQLLVLFLNKNHLKLSGSYSCFRKKRILIKIEMLLSNFSVILLSGPPPSVCPAVRSSGPVASFPLPGPLLSLLGTSELLRFPASSLHRALSKHGDCIFEPTLELILCVLQKAATA